MIKGIIFDLDGTLADTHEAQWKAFDYVFSKYGYPLSREDFEFWVKTSIGPQDWIIKNNLPLNPDKIRDEKKQIYDLLIQDEIVLKPGAREIIEKAYKKYKIAVASSSRIESIEAILKKFDLLSKFDTCLSCHGMENKKPHPDIYIKAAQELGLKPKDCLAIEDSLSGLESAKAAGMKCIVVFDNSWNQKKEDFKKADLIINSLEEFDIKSI